MPKIFKNLVWRMPKDEKSIYLTFDDGPTPMVTPWVLDQLAEYNAKATFFCVGKNVKSYPEIYQRIIDEGHEVGNHTYNHVNGWKTKRRAYLTEVTKCARLVNSNLFRPPYGRLRQSHYKVLKSKYRVIMWDILSGDFDLKISKEKCLKNVVSNARRGSIVVFHDSIKACDNLYYALPRVLENYSKFKYGLKSINSPSNTIHFPKQLI